MTLKKKRTKPRRTRTPRCTKQRCNKPASLAGLCKSHATREADRVFSLTVRGYGECYGKTGFWTGPEFKCAGVLQCAQLISRRYRNTRWNRHNAVPLCGAHHRWFDTHPVEREDMIRAWVSDYDTLRQEAIDDTLDWRLILLDYLLNPSGAEESSDE